MFATAAAVDSFAPVSHRDANGYPYRTTLVGTVTIGENRTGSESQEVAAWSRTIALTPGTYAVHLQEHGPTKSIVYTVDGTVADAHFPPLFAGSPIRGTDQAARDAAERGTPYQYRARLYPFAFAEFVINESAADHYELTNPDFFIKVGPFTSYDDTVSTMYRLEKVGSA